MRPVASQGSTCNWDKTNYGPICKFRVDLQLGEILVEPGCVSRLDAVTTGTTTNYVPSYELRVDLQLGQLGNYDPSCESRVDLQQG